MQYPSLANDNLLDVLRLIRTQNIGAVTFFRLMQKFGTAKDALVALPDLAKRGGGKNFSPYPIDDAKKEIEKTEKFGASMIVYGATDYPELLRSIPDPPPVIIVRGNADIWKKKPLIAIVGARNASAVGCQFAQTLAKDLGQGGVVVVSGLARGIDSFAHKGAVTTGTVGVIAGGIDNIYPPENAKLYAQIFEQGAVIAEQPFGALPFAGSFPSRNRIIAGMSIGTMVVEASPKSGSLITARLALENNREVFAVPNFPLDPRSKGGNQLLKQGATMVESASDVLEAIRAPRQFNFSENKPSDFAVNIADNVLEGLREVVLQKLSLQPVSIDELIEQCEASVGALQTVLLELEIAGRLRRSGGNKVSLIIS